MEEEGVEAEVRVGVGVEVVGVVGREDTGTKMGWGVEEGMD